MHLYVIAKGHHQHLQKWANDLSAKWVNMYQNGKPIEKSMQLGVRPVQLYEIGFPKEELENVMNCIGTGDYVLKRYPLINKMVKMLKKILKLKPTPKPKNPSPFYQPNLANKAVAVIPIGLKDDIMNKEGCEEI